MSSISEQGTNDLPLGEGEGVMRVEGSVFLQVKKSGIDWFDEIIEQDQDLINAIQGFDLIRISSRMNELRSQHNIIR